jgi:hypothetical protein
VADGTPPATCETRVAQALEWLAWARSAIGKTKSPDAAPMMSGAKKWLYRTTPE